MIYLDNAATSGKKPEEVVKSVNYALRSLSANPGRSGHKLSMTASEKIYETRKEIAEYFNSEEPENVVFTQNCTQSVNIVLKGVLERGDNVIVSDMEHNAVIRPLTAMRTESLTAETSLTDDDKTVENIEKLINNNTKMIFITAASNVTGKIMPLYKIGGIAKKHGILFGVDAAQAAGMIPIDMIKMNIDFLCVASHKGLYAPMGTGILIARKPINHTIIEGGTGTESINLNQPENMPERLESGTVNLPGIMGIKAGLKFIKDKDKIFYGREMSSIRRLYNSLKENENVIFYTPFPEDYLYVPVLSFNIKNMNSENVAEQLNDFGIAVRAGLHCAPCAHKKIGTEKSGTVRISPGYFNTNYDFNILENAIKKIGKNAQKNVDK